jgi:hypothetical protein
MSTESDPPTPAEESALCPKCLLANIPTAAFCAECGAPIGMVANVDPMQQIYAEGFGYRSAVEGPPRFIILLGMWMLFGPMALTGLVVLWNASSLGGPVVASSAVLALISVVILYRTTRNYLVKSRSANGPDA